MSIKDQIRAEIERLESENNCGTSDFIESKRIAYKQVKEALDSIPEQPISEDLKEEIATWIPAHIRGGDDEVWKDTKNAVTEWAGIVACHFTEWQKAKIMKDAVECDLYYDGDFLAIDLNMAALGYSGRDKVKIIIVKENEK